MRRTLHLEAFQWMQAELDRVVGHAHPDFDDRGSLPYFDCVIDEVLRRVFLPRVPCRERVVGGS